MSNGLKPRQDDTQKRYGMTMIVLGWLCILGILTLYFGDWIGRQKNPNQQLTSTTTENGAEEIQLRRNRAGHYVATGRINDTEVNFLLDTGATDISIPASVARKLKLRRGPPVLVHTANGTITIYTTRLEQVSLGEIVLHNVRAGINPHMDGEDVLLGMSFLGQLDFSQQGNTLSLRERPS